MSLVLHKAAVRATGGVSDQGILWRALALRRREVLTRGLVIATILAVATPVADARIQRRNVGQHVHAPESIRRGAP